MKVRIILVMLAMTLAITVPGVFGEKAAAKSEKTRFLVTHEYRKYTSKEKFKKKYVRKYKKTGELTWFRDYDFVSKEISKYYYGEKRRLIKMKETGIPYRKYIYSRNGRTVKCGYYYKHDKKFCIVEKYKFTKTGRLKEYHNVGSGERYVLRYKKGRLVEMRHYDRKGKLWLKNRAKYNKRGWLTKLSNTYYRFFGGTKFKKPWKDVSARFKYKIGKKYVYRYGKYKDYREGDTYKVTTKYRKKYKVRGNLYTDPFEMPYLPVKDGDMRYKYKFYKRGAFRGLVKSVKSYDGKSFYNEIKYKYKKVKMSDRRARIQHYLTNYFDEAIMMTDKVWYEDHASE